MLTSLDLKSKFGSVLGVGYSWKEISGSVVLTALALFYGIYCAFHFQVDIYLLDDRTTYHDVFSNIIILEIEEYRIAVNFLFVLWFFLNSSKRTEIICSLILAGILVGSYILNLSVPTEVVAIFSLPTILSIIFAKILISHGKITATPNRLAVNYLVIIATGLGALSIIISLLGGMTSNYAKVTDPFLIFYLILAYFSPILMFLCIFSVLINIITRPIIQKSRIIRLLHLDTLPQFYTNRSLVLFIIIFMIVSIIIVSIPHFNPARQDHPNVSVDVVYYETWISQLQNSSDASQFLEGLLVEISGGDRPLSLLLMLPVASFYPNDISASLELIMPLVLAPSLVLVMFLLARELTRNDSIAIICSFLSAISFQVLIGTYSGYYANWIGLIMMYLSFIFLIRYIRNSNNHLALYSFAALSLALLFIHPYTWSVAIIFTFIFVLVSYFLRLIKSRRIIAIICLILLSLVVFDVVKIALGLGPGAIGRNLFTIERTGTGVDQIEDRWSNLVRTVQVYVGGIYGNPFLLSLAFLGCTLLFYNSNRRYTTHFVLIFFSIGIIPLFLGDREILARIMYLVPFQIPAAIAIFWLMKWGVLGMSLSVALLLSILAASIRIATNI